MANWIGNGLNSISDFMDAAIDDVTSTLLLMIGIGPTAGGGTVLVDGVPVTSGTAANPPIGGAGTGNKDLPAEITIWPSTIYMTSQINLSEDQKYFPAQRMDNTVVPLSPIPMTLQQATTYVLLLDRSSRIDGIMTFIEADALNLTNMLGGPTEQGAKLHGGGDIGYFWHYHPQNNPHAHIWWLYP